MEKVFLRTAYNYDRNKASDESGLDCSVEPSMTQQQFAEECDINTIVRRFGVTGELPSGIVMPRYGDFDQVMDYHSAMNAIAQARESFDALPAEVRYRFNNDPQKLLEFCADDANAAEAAKLGLVDAEALNRAATLVSGAGGTPPTGKGAEAPGGPAGAGSVPPPSGGAGGG